MGGIITTNNIYIYNNNNGYEQTKDFTTTTTLVICLQLHNVYFKLEIVLNSIFLRDELEGIFQLMLHEITDLNGFLIARNHTKA